MSRRVQWTALWSALGVCATFALIVIGVDRYETQLTKVNWALVSLMCVFVFGGVAIYRWNADLARYNLIDMVMNSKTGKADPYRHLLFLFAGIAAWAIVQVVLAKSWDTLTPLLTLVLGFFVAKPTVDGLADAWVARPPSTASDGGNSQQIINAPVADTVNTRPISADAATDIDRTTIGPARKGKR